jgi:hypothetical protein
MRVRLITYIACGLVNVYVPRKRKHCRLLTCKENVQTCTAFRKHEGQQLTEYKEKLIFQEYQKVFCVLFVCKYVLYDCHRVSTQLKLNIYIYIYHIISLD